MILDALKISLGANWSSKFIRTEGSDNVKGNNVMIMLPHCVHLPLNSQLMIPYALKISLSVHETKWDRSSTVITTAGSH